MPLHGDLLPVEQYKVFDRLYDRFLIRPGGAGGERMLLSNTIQPVTDADRVARDVKAVEQASAEQTAGFTGTAVVFTVPDGVRYWLYFLQVSRAGDNQWDNVRLRETSTSTGLFLDETANASRTSLFLSTPFPLSPGNELFITLDGTGVAATTLTTTLWVEEELINIHTRS